MRDDIFDPKDPSRILLSKVFLPAFRNGIWYNCPMRYRVFEGARGTGKSYDFIGYEPVLKIMSNPYRNIMMVRQNDNSNRDSTFKAVKRAMEDLGVTGSFKIKEQDMTITFKTGQEIIFKGLNNPTTLNSVQAVVGWLTDVYIEEAYEITSWQAFRKLDGSLRLPKEAYDKGLFPQITMCLNAWGKDSFIYEHFFQQAMLGNPNLDNYEYLNDPLNSFAEYSDPNFVGPFGKGLYVHQSTWKTNPFLNDEYEESAHNTRNVSMSEYQVEFLGMWGNATAGTYESFSDSCIMSLEDITRTYGRFATFAIGVDTGLSNGEGRKRSVGVDESVEERVKSATVMTLVGVTEDFSNVIILEEYYHTDIEKNASNNTDYVKGGKNRLGMSGQLKACAEYLEKWIKKYQYSNIGVLDGAYINVYVDSADIGFQEMLSQEFRYHPLIMGNSSVYVRPSTKLSTQTRVDFENTMMAWGNFKVNKDCKNVIREIRNARRDKHGRAREDNDDHALTSMEYGFTPLLGDVSRWKSFKPRNAGDKEE